MAQIAEIVALGGGAQIRVCVEGGCIGIEGQLPLACQHWLCVASHRPHPSAIIVLQTPKSLAEIRFR